jgi:hypothetical protein
VTAKAVVFGGVTKNDDVGCHMFDGGGTEVDASYTQLDSVNGTAYNQQTVALTAATTVGGLMQLQCADTATEAIVNHTSITAVPVASVISAAPQHQAHAQSGASAARADR